LTIAPLHATLNPHEEGNIIIRRAISLLIVLALAAPALARAAPQPSIARSALPGARACPIFPPSNVWNRPVSNLPVADDSATLIATIGLHTGLHPDFGHEAAYGIPYTVVDKHTTTVHVSFDYADESDHVPYPIPPHPKVEAGSDRHILIVDRSSCNLYELYNAQRRGATWHAGSGAVWNLRSNALRPDSWTSADAAGLPGLVREDELRRGVIDHALRFTAPRTRSAHIYPARHDAGAGNDPALPRWASACASKRL
jgi:hypothetical protein